ncbi:zinc ABC transporter substrate-binding protein AztC [Gordonia sp. PKS22-38]|uniref:Zinc ABC transporter substrate-binding protein AztC n=1 Tax=Gordonia prachuapensis TaxID=3115651 RepID=A0ABU7MN19_9ACTN|nr:zinc ABC transporter substrate-binding protein AztC [Gordonia sp. PKS22-38]
MTSPKRYVLAAILAMVAAVAATGCGTESDERPQVVATTNILGDVVNELVGDQADVTTLMKPNADPHSFGISASEANTMRTSGLIVYNGLGLEEGIQQHVDAAEADGVPTLEVAAQARPLPYATGDAEGSMDPHFWTDPTRMTDATQAISQALSEVEGIDQQQLQASTDAYLAELDELDQSMESQFAAIPPDKRKLVTNHHVFGYLADRYDFEVIGAIIPSGTTLASPSSSDLASLATAIRESNVPAVFVDTSRPDRLAQALANETGAQIEIVPLYSESLDQPGTEADTYVKMMQTNASRISSALTP